jgi:hypothetical protein
MPQVSRLPFVSNLPYFIAVDPIGPIEGSPFRSLGEALNGAKMLQNGSGHWIRSINQGDEPILTGSELRAALGPRPQIRSTFYVTSDVGR